MNLLFYYGSNISSNASYSDPRIDLPILSTSSNNITGFSVPHVFSVYIILPGYDPKYVFLCPFNIAISCSPPNDILPYFLPKHFAILAPILVLPTPGGPTNNNDLPLREPLNDATAINSSILFLTSSSP